MARLTIRWSPAACDGVVADEICALPESERCAQSSKAESHFQDSCEKSGNIHDKSCPLLDLDFDQVGQN